MENDALNILFFENANKNSTLDKDLNIYCSLKNKKGKKIMSVEINKKQKNTNVFHAGFANTAIFFCKKKRETQKFFMLPLVKSLETLCDFFCCYIF